MIRRLRQTTLLGAGLLVSAPAAAALLQQEHAGGGSGVSKFLGLPVWVWSLANMLLFFGLLAKFLAKPIANYFKKRQEEIEENLRRARHDQAEAERLKAELRERLARLDSEIEQIRRRGAVEGEQEKAALVAEGERAAEKIRGEAEEEIARELASAKAQLARAAADLAARAAREVVERSLTEADRSRLLEEAVGEVERAR